MLSVEQLGLNVDALRVEDSRMALMQEGLARFPAIMHHAAGSLSGDGPIPIRRPVKRTLVYDTVESDR